MLNLDKHGRSAKPGRYRRPVILVIFALVLLGAVGFGSLQLFEREGQDRPSNNIQTNISTIAQNSRLSKIESTPGDTKPSSLESTEITDSNDELDRSRTDESEAEEPLAEEQTALAISGAVLDDSGEPLPDILVMAQPTLHSGTNQSSSGTAEQVTDRLGAFIFDKLAQGEYELRVAENEIYYPASLRVRAGVSNAEIVLQRIRSVRVYGIITDDVGNPIQGVKVRALGKRLKVYSDVSGAYEIQTGPSKPGQAPVLDFSMKDYQDSRHRVEGALNSKVEEVQLNVELEWESRASRVTVSGQVTGPTGDPVGGARLWLSASGFQSYDTTRSNALGEYQFKSVKKGDTYTLGVEPDKEYAAFKSGFLSIGPGDLVYDVKLDATEYSNLSGIVTDLDGTPLRGFSLWARSMDMGRHPLIPVYTDGTGQFQLEQIPSGAIKLESRSQPWLEATGIVLKPGESRYVEVPLDWGQNWLLGQVVDDQGAPVARAQLVLRWSRTYMDVNSESRREIMTDLEGYFAVSNLDAEDYTVIVQAAGFESSRVQYRRDQGDREIRITLLRRDSQTQTGKGG